MAIPGQEVYDREYQWSTFVGEFVEIRVLIRPMDLWVRARHNSKTQLCIKK